MNIVHYVRCAASGRTRFAPRDHLPAGDPGRAEFRAALLKLPAQLASLRPLGMATWAQAMLKWGLSDP